MSIRTIRDELAAGITAAGIGVYGYARPPGQVAVFPAAIVGDPDEIRYHAAAGRRTIVRFTVRVIVGRSSAQDQVAELDDLITYTALPAAIEAISGASWVDIAVVDITSRYADFQQAGQLVGVAADLNVTATLNN